MVSILFWWHPLVVTLGLALANDAYTHILLILPLSAALIYLDLKYRDSKALRSRSAAEPSHRCGSAGSGAADGWLCEMGDGGSADDVRLSLGMFALVTWWIAGVLLCFGARAFQSLLFPLCFLFLMVPIPESALSGIVEFLQQQSAFAARIMFRAAGVPATQDGIMLSIPGLDIEVARECSSIRSSLMLVVTTMVLAHLFLRSWWRKVLLVAAAIPLSVAKNGLRIFTIAELGTRVDPGFLQREASSPRRDSSSMGSRWLQWRALLWMLRRTEFPMPIEASSALFLE